MRTSGSEIWGVVRCAAPELQSSTAFDGCDGDLNASDIALPEHARAHGAQGITVRGGSIATPTMLPSALKSRCSALVTPPPWQMRLGSIMRGGDYDGSGDAASHLRQTLALASTAPRAPASDGATVVTGGLGGLGQLVASWDVRNEQRNTSSRSWDDPAGLARSIGTSSRRPERAW